VGGGGGDQEINSLNNCVSLTVIDACFSAFPVFFRLLPHT
jgi:hypothetical protein